MKMSFDFQAEMESRMQAVFGDFTNNLDLHIEISTFYPDRYHILFLNWTSRNVRSPIEGFFAEYKFDEGKVIVYLPVISITSNLAVLKFEHLTKVISYYGIGLWIFHNTQYRGKSFSRENYNLYGTVFRNFVALMIAYIILKYDGQLVRCFENLVCSLNKECTLCLRFIRIIRDDKVYLPGLKIEDIMKLSESVMISGDENISQDYLVEYFDDYITNCIYEDPGTANYFRDIMTVKQKDKWKHISEEYGFFDE